MLSIIYFFSMAIYGQDQIYLNNSISLDCKIISIEENIINYEDGLTGQTKTLRADSLKGFLYEGKQYYFNEKRQKILKLKPSYEDPNTTDTYLRLSVFIPGFSFENRLGESLSINVEAGVGFIFGYSNNDLFTEVYILYYEPDNSGVNIHYTEKESYIHVYPYLKLELRKYYSLLWRQRKSRSTLYNSANYFSLYSLTFWDNLYVVGPTWGMQRNTNRFYFNINLGAGLYFWPGTLGVYPIVDYRIGIRIGK